MIVANLDLPTDKSARFVKHKPPPTNILDKSGLKDMKMRDHFKTKINENLSTALNKKHQHDLDKRHDMLIDTIKKVS